MKNRSLETIRVFDKKSLFDNIGINYSSTESVNNRIICLMRLLLAVSGLIITFIDPTSPDRFVVITYFTLSAYCTYSAILYSLSLRDKSSISTRTITWIDMAWYLVLISLSSGTNSIFYLFFLFSILVAAFRSGFKSGLYVTFASAILFTVVGYAAAPQGVEFELNRFLIRSVYLVIFGYLISYWGGQEIKFKRHLMLFKDVTRLSNLRFGVNQTLSDILNRLRTFYDAESCVLISFDSSPATYEWREANRNSTDENLIIEKNKAFAPLVKLPGELAVFYQNNSDVWYRSLVHRAYDVSTGDEVEIAPDICTALADLLEAESYFTVPVIKRDEMVGRLYLTSRKNRFVRSELEFISQVINQALISVENVELLNKLASSAADNQRQKISRDIHDTTIQPYIGIKLGLEAIEIKCAAGKPVETEIANLIKLTDTTISDLRGYVSRLKGEVDEIEVNALILAIKKQAVKFREFYDINVRVEAADNFQINDRLAAEIFQIVSEGLSNIKRHTNAKNGTIRVYKRTEKLFLEIENENQNAASEFVPKSITGRAESLGGAAQVEKLDNHTKVIVEIPL